MGFSDLINNLGYPLSRRHHLSQRVRFVKYITEWSKSEGISVKISVKKRSFDKRIAVVLGDIETCETILFINYNTPSVFHFKKLKQYIFNEKKSIKANVINEIIRFSIFFLLGMISIYCFYRVTHVAVIWKIVAIIMGLITGGIAILSLRGISNVMNMNNNTATLAMVLSNLENDDILSKVSVCLYDDAVLNEFQRCHQYVTEKNPKASKIILSHLAKGEKTVFLLKKHDDKKENVIQQICAQFQRDVLIITEDSNKYVIDEATCWMVSCDEFEDEYIVKNSRTNNDCYVDIDLLENHFNILKALVGMRIL